MAGSGRERGVLFLIFSIMGAMGVTLMVYNLIQEARNRIPAQKPAETGKVVVAAKNIAPGWTITPEMLQERELPINYIPLEAIKTQDEVIGRVAMERVLFGEFVREDRLAAPEAGVGMPAIIPQGMRAYQIEVRGGQGMSGFLSPGNFVDVVAVCPKVIPPEVRTILEQVTVLAVNDKMVDDSYEEETTGGKKKKAAKVKPSVTMALTPNDTVIVKHAGSECELYLALRNDIDVTRVESNDPDQQALQEGPSAPLEGVEAGVQLPPEAIAPPLPSSGAEPGQPAAAPAPPEPERG